MHSSRNSLSRRDPILALTVSLMLFTGIALLAYPYYQYSVYSDIISHLSISRRYATGDITSAINGFWSPLNAWIVALVVRSSGSPLYPTAYGVATGAFAGIIAISIRLFRMFIRGRAELYFFGITSAVFWGLGMQVSLFADGLNCLLLLCYLYLLLRPGFSRQPWRWLLAGLLAGLAYYSKAYSFYILPLITFFVLIAGLKNEDRLSWRRCVLICGTIVLTTCVLAAPWVYLLHRHYGVWTLSTAGAVNTNWAISGRMYFREDLVLVPPARAGGLSCWEDVWIHRGTMLKPWDSPAHMAKQLARIVLNLGQYAKLVSEFSPFYLPVLVAALLRLRRGTRPAIKALCIPILLFPLGYLSMVMATRYLWFTVPLSMILGLYTCKELFGTALGPLRWRLFSLVYFISWLPGVVMFAKESFREGKTDYEMAQLLQARHIRGSFMANRYEDYQRHFRISWYSGNPFYLHVGDHWDTRTLLAEAKRQGVQYYYYYFEGTGGDYELRRPDGSPYPEVTGGSIPGLKVFLLAE